MMKNTNRGWCKNEEKTFQEIIHYFQQIFTIEEPDDFIEIFQGIPQTITAEMNRELIRKVTEQEISQAIFLMQPNKSPGPNGMSPIFYQKFWSIIKTDIVNAVNSFFHSGYLLKSINETLIGLIPKPYSPSTLTEFRPISLCNVLYKIIFEVLTNRFKCVLNSCHSHPQSAFVPERQNLDNVLITHESIHVLKNKRIGRDYYIAIKLDMSKTYDRVEWRFLDKVMLKMWFCPRWISWVMECVTSITYSININRENKDSLGQQEG